MCHFELFLKGGLSCGQPEVLLLLPLTSLLSNKQGTLRLSYEENVNPWGM